MILSDFCNSPKISMLAAHNSGVNEPTEGERIALRRNRLGWKQGVLAQNAGVSLGTVVSIEKDRGVRTESLKAVVAALDKAEKKKRPGPPLSAPSGTTEASMKEGADASHFDTALDTIATDIDNTERVMHTAIANLRQARLALDALRARRKSG